MIYDCAPGSWRGVATGLKTLEENCGNLKRECIGRSVLGCPIFAAKIGCGVRRVLVVAGQHGNEWIGTRALMRFIVALCGGCVCGIAARDLLDKCTFFFVPLANPDGVELAQGRSCRGEAFNNARLIGGDFPEIPFPTGWKANINGVDLNLQFPAGWERARQIKFSAGFDRPAPRDYVGPSPLSEPESRSLAEYTRFVCPDTVVALHSQGEVIYWRYNGYEPSGSRALGERMSRVSGYTLELTPPLSDNAGFKDWFIAEFGRPGYTVELGLGENPLPDKQLAHIFQRAAAILVQAALW